MRIVHHRDTSDGFEELEVRLDSLGNAYPMNYDKPMEVVFTSAATSSDSVHVAIWRSGEIVAQTWVTASEVVDAVAECLAFGDVQEEIANEELTEDSGSGCEDRPFDCVCGLFNTPVDDDFDPAQEEELAKLDAQTGFYAVKLPDTFQGVDGYSTSESAVTFKSEIKDFNPAAVKVFFGPVGEKLLRLQELKAELAEVEKDLTACFSKVVPTDDQDKIDTPDAG